MTFLRSTLGILFFSLSLQMVAQSPADHVPMDVSFAVSFHPDHINDKVSLREFQQMAFFQMLVDQLGQMGPSGSRDQVEEALANPASIGLNDMADVFFFSKMTEEVNYFGISLGLTDPAKFNSFLMDISGGEAVAEKIDGHDYIQVEEDVAIGWTSNNLIIAVAEVKNNWWDEPYYEEIPDYDYEEESDEDWDDWEEEDRTVDIQDMGLLEELAEEIEEMPAVEEEEWIEEESDYDDYEDPYDDNREEEETKEWIRSLLSRDFGASINAQQQYRKATAGGSDFNFWMDYSTLPAMAGGDPYGDMGMITSMLGGMYEGMFMNMGMNFNDGQIDMDMEIFGNEDMLEMWRASYDSKYDKSLLKYVDGTDLLGYMHLNFSVEGLMESYKDLMKPMLAEMSGMGETAGAAWDVLGIAIDEEALYEIFTGDAMVAFTGLSEFTRTVITYEYDDNFNATEIEKEVKEYFPEFSFMAGYGDENSIDKIIRLIETSGLLANMGNYYSLQIPDVPGEFYLAKANDILFFTNDTELVGNYLQSGFPSSRQLAKTHKKTMKKSASNFFWDIPNTMSLLSTSGMDMGGTPGEFLNIGKQNFESLQMNAPKKVGDSSTMSMTLKMVDQDTNALEQIMELVNNMVMDMMGGESRS